jgi:putative ubiquitin-RnfH superfamily antitoxin RatB of RatAB toxin-antitoxin module
MEMTLAMTDINDIKELYFKKGLNVAEIIRKTGHDRKTVNKYLEKTDFNIYLEASKRSKRGSKLDPFKETIKRNY